MDILKSKGKNVRNKNITAMTQMILKEKLDYQSIYVSLSNQSIFGTENNDTIINAENDMFGNNTQDPADPPLPVNSISNNDHNHNNHNSVRQSNQPSPNDQPMAHATEPVLNYEYFERINNQQITITEKDRRKARSFIDKHLASIKKNLDDLMSNNDISAIKAQLETLRAAVRVVQEAHKAVPRIGCVSRPNHYISDREDRSRHFNKNVSKVTESVCISFRFNISCFTLIIWA